MARFAGKVVVVTGGGGGIGGATCRRFAHEAAKVAVLDLNLDAAKKGRFRNRRAPAAPLKPSPATSPIVPSRRRRRRRRDRFRPHRYSGQQRRLGCFPPFLKTEPAQWDKLIAINLTGALNMHHAVLPRMAAREPAASSTSPPTPPASALGAKRSTPPARAGWSRFPRPWRVSIRGTGSPSTSSARARPIRLCSTGLRKAPATRKS